MNLKDALTEKLRSQKAVIGISLKFHRHRAELCFNLLIAPVNTEYPAYGFSVRQQKFHLKRKNISGIILVLLK